MERLREQERLAAEESQRRERARLEGERLALEEAERLERERLAIEEAQRLARERMAMEDQQRRDRERLAVEDAQRREQERLAAQEAQRRERERVAMEETQRIERERLAMEEVQRQERERLAAEEALRREERLAAELAQRREAERLAAEETARRNREALAGGSPGSTSGTVFDRSGAGAGQGSGAGAGLGNGGTRAGAIPRSMFDSDVANRAREAVRGLGVLSGTPPQQPPGARDPRRVLAGRVIRDVPLKMYVESWRQKIERNGHMIYSSARGSQVQLLVVVAIRNDGSVEDVSIARSSGRPDLDNAVRSLVRLNARYSPFPPNIAAQYDVIEIRRVWVFGDSLKVLEEVN